MNEPQGEGFWGKRKARWYSEGLRHSDYADKVVGVMEPVVAGCDSLLDIGAGCGALCIPLARVFDRVVALDSSAAMLDELRTGANSAGVENISTELAAWEDAEKEAGDFDVVLCANVLGVLNHPHDSIPRLEKHAKRFVFLLLGTPGNADKFYFRELWPLIFGSDPPKKSNYFDAYGALYRLGIFANVAVVDYNFDQPFRDIEEAVSFWKDHMRLSDDRWDKTLREFLLKRLERSGDLLWARVPKQSAIIWWRARGRR